LIQSCSNGKEGDSKRALNKGSYSFFFSALEAMSRAVAFGVRSVSAMSGVLISGVQRAEPLLNRGSEKGWILPFSVA
jgi:hypothetical protein